MKVPEWVTKADGAGDSDVEAEKGAISDALKRAAVKWGIGRYLYDLGNIWVDTEPAGRSVRIKKDQYGKLQDALTRRFGGKPSKAPAKAAERAKTFNDYLTSITASKSQDDLKTAWAAINSDRQKISAGDMGNLEIAKNAKKAELIAPGNNLDKIESGEVK